MKTSLTDNDRNALIMYRFTRADEALDDAIAMFEQNRMNVCVNRIYYACFYALIGTLLNEGVETKTHDGVKRMFGLKLVMPGKIDRTTASYFSQLYNARITGDYDEFVVFTSEEVGEMINKARKLIEALKRIVGI